MKKNILKFAFASAFALVAGYSVHTSQKETTIYDLGVNDIEALASNERGCVNGPNCWGYCFVNGGRYSCENYWIWNCVSAIN